jgi:hypothetical protein
MMTVIFASVAAFAMTALTGSSLPTTMIFDVDRRQRSWASVAPKLADLRSALLLLLA